MSKDGSRIPPAWAWAYSDLELQYTAICPGCSQRYSVITKRELNGGYPPRAHGCGQGDSPHEDGAEITLNRDKDGRWSCNGTDLGEGSLFIKLSSGERKPIDLTGWNLEYM